MSTSCPGQHAPISDCPRFRSAVPVDSGPGPSARGVDQLSQATRAFFRGPAVSTNCPGRLAPVSELRRVCSAVPGNSGPCLRSRGVDQLSWMTRAFVRVLKVSTSCPGLLQYSLRARGVTSCPGRLGPVSEVPQGRPPLPGDSGPCPKSRRVYKISRANQAIVQGLWGRSHVPGDFAPFQRCHGVDQLFWMTCAGVLVVKVSTSSPGLLTIRSEGPQCHQLAWTTPSCV